MGSDHLKHFVQRSYHQLLLILTAVVLSVIMTWPFASNITSFYSDQGDNSLGGTVLWYNSESIKSGRIFNPEQYFAGFQFYPQPFSLNFANNHIAPSLIFSPIYWATNNLPLSVNFYALLTLILSFITSFYLINYFVKNPLASIVGAFIFSFNAQTFIRFPQHLDILSKFFLPLVFLFAYQLLEKPSFKKGLLFGLFFSLNSLTVNYFQIFSLVMLPILAIPFFWSHLRKKEYGYFKDLVKSSLIALIFLPILLYFNLPYLEFSQKEGAYRPLQATPFFSARMTDWIAATPDNLIYGGFVKNIEKFREPKDNRNILNYEEHTLFLGFLPIILFIYGSRIKSGMTREGKWFFYLLLIFPFILTFGPYFNGADEGLPLPFYFLYKLVPIMEGIRSPIRFEFLFFIPFALIASFGAKKLLEKFGRVRGIWVIGGILLLLILETFSVKSYDSRSIALSEVAKVAGAVDLSGKAVIHLPIYSVDDADEFGKNSAYLNWLTQTGERIVNGNSSYLPGDQLALLDFVKQDQNQGFSLLSKLGVNYAVIHKNAQQQLKIPEKGLILNTNEIAVIDLSSYVLETPQCLLEDLDIQVTEARDDQFNPTLALIVTNKKNCFLLSPGENKYQQKDNIHFKLPVVMGPNQQLVLSVANREVRVE